MAIPYSERFICAFVEDDEVTYEVPAGKRAIIRCFTWCPANLEDPAIGRLTLLVPEEVRLLFAIIGNGFPLYVQELHIVAYAGDVILCSTSGEGSFQVSGYLLSNP